MTYIISHSVCTKQYTIIKLCTRFTHMTCNNTLYEKHILDTR